MELVRYINFCDVEEGVPSVSLSSSQEWGGKKGSIYHVAAATTLGNIVANFSPSTHKRRRSVRICQLG